MDELSLVVVGAVSVTLLVVVAVQIRSALTRVGSDELVVVSGLLPRGHRESGEQSVRGARTLTEAGRVFVLPYLQRVDRMDVTPFGIEVELEDVPVRNGETVSVRAEASLSFALSGMGLPNLVESFLGRPFEEVEDGAKRLLRSNLYTTLATMKRDELAEYREEYTERLEMTIELDMEMVGLVIDDLQVVEVE